MLPIWGSKFQRQQWGVRIRILERLHGDTNRLVLYLAHEALDIAWDFSLMCWALAVMAFVVGPTLTVQSVVWAGGLLLGSSISGNVIRLRRLMRDLQNYDQAIAELKRKQDTL
jgi:hypothetical protein